MKLTTPEVFLVAETTTQTTIPGDDGGPEAASLGLGDYLSSIDASEWRADAPSDGEELITAAGKLCYRSWKPGMNANVSKVRDDNKEYIGNILNSGHGSVLEHASATFIFKNVSRVFTHELVRHRVGVAISQESLRFVRLEDLNFWLPQEVLEEPEAVRVFTETVEYLERQQKKLAQIFRIDDPTYKFSKKKKITSAMRRIAPEGLGTSIVWTANMRTLRHCIKMRTARHAEEEIRLVFNKVAEICVARWLHVFQDMKSEMVDGYMEHTFENQT